jgi:hypothetical protein
MNWPRAGIFLSTWCAVQAVKRMSASGTRITNAAAMLRVQTAKLKTTVLQASGTVHRDAVTPTPMAVDERAAHGRCSATVVCMALSYARRRQKWRPWALSARCEFAPAAGEVFAEDVPWPVDADVQGFAGRLRWRLTPLFV